MFLIVFPAFDKLTIMRLSRDSIQGEIVFSHYMDIILNLGVSEYVIINDRYLIVRVD